ncbi:MAG: pseudouridine synthase, partial [Christiangramia sp.]
KKAKTQANTIKNYVIDRVDYTLLELNPLTGRTHQLRIHLSENKSPIIGDKIYGLEETGYFKNKSLFLFAGKILVEHPVFKKAMSLELQLPKRFRNLDYYRAD